MARNRQRARDRKARQDQENHLDIHHENVSGELEHASGEVEEFDASLIQGAGGEPEALDEQELTELEEAAVPSDDPDVVEERRPAVPKPGGNRVLNFLRA